MLLPYLKTCSRLAKISQFLCSRILVLLVSAYRTLSEVIKLVVRDGGPATIYALLN